MVITSAMVINGAASSSVIVNVAVDSVSIFPLIALDNVIVAISISSSSSSARTGTLNVPDVNPAAIVNVPEVAV